MPEDYIPTTTSQWLSDENPHNVDTFAEFKAEVSKLTAGIEDWLRTAPHELAVQFKKDLAELVAKYHEIKNKI